MNKYVSTFSDIAQNQIINGTVIGQNEKEIIMDIGFKSEGIIPRTEFSTVSIPDLGENMDVYLEKIEDKNGQTILSVEKAVWMKGWMKLMQIQKEDKTVMGKVIRRIKGGVIVDVEGIQAFLPGSQIDVRPVQDFDNLLGKELEFKIVKDSIFQTATFRPKGLWGRVYWYVLSPFHYFIFRVMLRNLSVKKSSFVNGNKF